MHQRGGAAPGGRFVRIQCGQLSNALELLRILLHQTLRNRRREVQVHLRHRVGVVVVVDQRRVLVRSRHLVDDEAALAVVAADTHPDARRLHDDFGAMQDQVFVIVARFHVQLDGIGDIGVDVVLRGTSREVGRAFLAGDGTPRVQRAARMRHLARPLAGLRQAGVTVLQQLARDLRLRVQEEREDVDFRVPEIVALVALARHALGRDIGLAVAAHRLQQMELVEVDALL